MLKLLVPVDGSDNAARVIEYVIDFVTHLKQADVQLITVRDAMDSLQVHRFWSAEQIHAFQQEAGNAALAPARKRLDETGVRYSSHIAIGEIAQAITEFARQEKCDMIIMGTRGMGGIGNLLMGSVATKVVHLADRPVTLVK